MMRQWDGNIPAHIPQDLLTNRERVLNESREPVFWIRTWYGTEDDDGIDPADRVTRATADASYHRLYRRAILGISDEEDESEPRDGEKTVEDATIFDDDPNEFGVLQRSSEEDVAPPGTVPSFLVSALVGLPDSFDGVSASRWRDSDQETIEEETEWLSITQHLLVFVADRKACESGWVLQIGVTHVGEVMPLRVRNIAANTRDDVNQWTMLGHAVNVCPEDRTERVFYSPFGEGWDNY